MAPPTITRSQMAGMSPKNMLVGHISPAPYNERFAKIWGNNLTPQVASQMLAQGALGYLWWQQDLFDELREKDTHLHSCLSKREMRVAGAEWEIRPPAGKGKQAQNIADWCRERLEEIEAQGDLGRSFADGVLDLLGAVFYGRAVLEAIWVQDGRYWYPGALEFVHSRRCAYATDWRMHLWDAQGTATSVGYLPSQPSDFDESRFGTFPGIPLDVFPAGKFVVHRPRVRGVYPTREGLGPLVVWYSLYKRFDFRDWLAFAEWAGRGLRIGTVSSGRDPDMPGRATPEDEEVLKQMLDDMSSSFSAVIPDTTKIDIHDAPNTNDVHEKLLFACNNEMSKAILLETLTTEVSVSGANRALGEVHDEIGQLLAMQDARQLEATIRRDILRPMVQRSFGRQAPVPSFHVCLEPKEDMDKLVARVKTMAMDVGLPVSRKWLYDQLGWPEPGKGDELTGVGTPDRRPEQLRQPQ